MSRYGGSDMRIRAYLLQQWGGTYGMARVALEEIKPSAMTVIPALDLNMTNRRVRDA